MRTNNILDAMVRHIQAGANPGALIDQMARNDPGVAQAVKMIQGKNADQLRTMAQNMAKERGTSVEQIAQSLGLRLPK